MTSTETTSWETQGEDPVQLYIWSCSGGGSKIAFDTYLIEKSEDMYNS
jgi:hypothetical protein